MKYQGLADSEGQIEDIKNRKIWLEDVKQYESRAGLEKGLLDTLASTSPLLADQLGYKERALALEIEMGHLHPGKEAPGDGISKEQKAVPGPPGANRPGPEI